MFNREIITLQIGSRGSSLGSAFLRQVAAEHGIVNDRMAQDIVNAKGNNWNTLFYEDSESIIKPRAILIDLDPTDDVGSECNNGLAYSMHNNDSVYIDKNRDQTMRLSGEDFAKIEEAARKQIERCNLLQGFYCTRDSREYTSVLLNNESLIECLSLGKKHFIDFCLVPDRLSSDAQLVNATITHNFLGERSDIHLLFQDSAIKRRTGSSKKSNLNRFLAKAMSNMTTSERLESTVDTSLNESYSLIPYPSLNFAIPSYEISNNQISQPCVFEEEPILQSPIVRSFNKRATLCDVDLSAGYYFRVQLFTRGIKIPDLQPTIQYIKNRGQVKFFAWSPSGFKCGVNNYKDWSRGTEFSLPDQSVTSTAFNSCFGDIFKVWKDRFDELKAINQLTALLESLPVDPEECSESLERLNMAIMDCNELNQNEPNGDE